MTQDDLNLWKAVKTGEPIGGEMMDLPTAVKVELCKAERDNQNPFVSTRTAPGPLYFQH